MTTKIEQCVVSRQTMPFMTLIAFAAADFEKLSH